MSRDAIEVSFDVRRRDCGIKMFSKFASGSTATRSSTEQWLIGHPIPCIVGCKLPSTGQVLQRFVYHHKIDKKPVRESARCVVDEILPFWEKARIPTQFPVNIVDNLVSLYQKTYQSLLKNKSRSDKKTLEARQDFQQKLNCLFDIAHEDAENKIQIKEDYDFLLAQREVGRRGVMAGPDLVLSKKEEREMRKAASQMEQKRRSDEEKNLLFKKVQKIENVSSESDSEVDDKEDVDSNANLAPRQRKRVDFVSPEIVSAMVRTNTTTRKGLHILEATATTHGFDLDKTNLSYSSLYRARKSYTSKLANQVKTNFNAGHGLVVHWDGKLLWDMEGKCQSSFSR